MTFSHFRAVNYLNKYVLGILMRKVNSILPSLSCRRCAYEKVRMLWHRDMMLVSHKTIYPKPVGTHTDRVRWRIVA